MPLGAEQLVGRLESADAQVELVRTMLLKTTLADSMAASCAGLSPLPGPAVIGGRFVDARRVDEQERNVLVKDARGQQIQAVEMESGGRALGCLYSE